jgi:TorA maturation chaperone TorD
VSLQGLDLREVEKELAAEYATLFLNMGRRPVHPFESVYTSSERLMMQEAHDEVLNIYLHEGVGKVEEFKLPEDHIAVELDFMSYLCQKNIDAIKKGDDEAASGYLTKQKDFLEKHLLVWIPAFCLDLEKMTRSIFYKAIANITRDFVEFDQDTLKRLIHGDPICSN